MIMNSIADVSRKKVTPTAVPITTGVPSLLFSSSRPEEVSILLVVAKIMSE